MPFIYQLAADVNEMCRDDGKNTSGLLLFIVLSVVTCGIYGIIWWYGTCERIGQAAMRRGLHHVKFSGATYLLWAIVGTFICGIGSFVAVHLLCDAANKVGAHYNQEILGSAGSASTPVW